LEKRKVQFLLVVLEVFLVKNNYFNMQNQHFK